MNATDARSTGANKIPIECRLDFPVQRSFHVGKGAAILIRGWVYSPAEKIEKLYVVDGASAYAVRNHSWVRPDVFQDKFPGYDPNGYSLFSEFIFVLPIEEIKEETDRDILLRVQLSSGVVEEKLLTTLHLIPDVTRTPANATWPGTGPKVAICMATYNPSRELFEKQISSIVAQTHKNWICIITDDSPGSEARELIKAVTAKDSRFHYFHNAERLGFYINFQECLSRVPADAEFVALSDHDDYWYPEKLERLLAELDGNVKLAYSDCRITRGDVVISDTFWSTRRNNYTDLSSLFIANTITGAACVFAREVLDYALPFPQYICEPYHDQWIALVAHTLGGIAYVDEPLYDYNQHGTNVIGHSYGRSPGTRAALSRFLNTARSGQGFLGAGNFVLHEAWNQFSLIIQKAVFAETIALRNRNLKRRDLIVVNRMRNYPNGLFEPLRQKFLSFALRRPTLNVEGLLLWSAMGVTMRNFYYRSRRSAFLSYVVRKKRAAQERNLRRLGVRPEAASAAAEGSRSLAEGAGSGTVMSSNVFWIFHNIEPLNLKVTKSEPKRVNLILATIDFRYIFGGYIGMFSLALRLRREGFAIRIILTELTDFNLAVWKEEIKKYPGVTNLFEEVEVIYRFDRTEEVLVNPDDEFLATNCWASHIAHKAHARLKKERFMFMVQEYEPYFLPMNSISALFQQSYQFPQFDLFSTYHLRDFFKNQKIGVFAGAGGAQNHAVFQNAIQKFTPSLENLRNRERRILFYARPEEHAARNLYELGMKALVDLAASPGFDADNWKIYGMGSIGGAGKAKLTSNVAIELLPKTDLQTYREILPQHDVGLSLMLTPHPSLVPLEMASAGMWAVTNTFANKTAESLRSISTNIIAVEPTLEAIVGGLQDAISRVDQYDERLAGAKIDWPTDWNDAFSKDAIRKIVKFLS